MPPPCFLLNLTLHIYPTHLERNIYHVQYGASNCKVCPFPPPLKKTKKKERKENRGLTITVFLNPMKHSLFQHFFITRSEKYNIILIKQKVPPLFPNIF